jgi:hypothetical protein
MELRSWMPHPSPLPERERETSDGSLLVAEPLPLALFIDDLLEGHG